MSSLKDKYKTFKYQFDVAKRVFKDEAFYQTYRVSKEEGRKKGSRTEIISFLLDLIDGENYLEIGVRNPNDNFNKIKCKNKFSVDPGIEYKENPVDFKLTSDEFFKEMYNQNPEFPFNKKFDVIFIDGLHLADQVETDILNSLRFIKDTGFIVLHDCNPPTEFHARESFNFRNSPARGFWNGTTWKAFYKFRHHADLFSICFDSDWGVGVLSKNKYLGFNNLTLPIENPYFEIKSHFSNKNRYLNLQHFENWNKKVK